MSAKLVFWNKVRYIRKELTPRGRRMVTRVIPPTFLRPRPWRALRDLRSAREATLSEAWTSAPASSESNSWTLSCHFIECRYRFVVRQEDVKESCGQLLVLLCNFVGNASVEWLRLKTYVLNVVGDLFNSGRHFG